MYSFTIKFDNTITTTTFKDSIGSKKPADNTITTITSIYFINENVHIKLTNYNNYFLLNRKCHSNTLISYNQFRLTKILNTNSVGSFQQIKSIIEANLCSNTVISISFKIESKKDQEELFRMVLLISYEYKLHFISRINLEIFIKPEANEIVEFVSKHLNYDICNLYINSLD